MSDESRPTGRAGREDADVAERSAHDPELFEEVLTDFYRAEVDRMITWRTRLDQTTNWAVVVLAAILTWAFSSPGHPHYVLLVGALAMVAFLLIEGQRYQEYDTWRTRVRLLQEMFFADVYAPDDGDAPTPDHEDDRNWREDLARDLRNPSIRISYWEAVGHRLSHIYIALLTIIFAAWTARITVFAKPPAARAAAIESVPGGVVIAVVAVVYLAAVGMAVWSFARAPRREFDEDIDVVRSDGEK